MKIFWTDPTFNKYGNVKEIFETTAPTMMKIVSKIEELDVVKDYLKKDGHLPLSGMGNLW